MLNDNLYCEDGIIRDMTQRMKEKFDKYWKEYSIVLAFEVILDPRMKFKFLEFCYSKINPSIAEGKRDFVKIKLYKLL